jgi:hypothetical protein
MIREVGNYEAGPFEAAGDVTAADWRNCDARGVCWTDAR